MYFLHFEMERSHGDAMWLRVAWYQDTDFSDRRSYSVRLQYTLFEPNSPAYGKAVRSRNSLTSLMTRLRATRCGVRILDDYEIKPTKPGMDYKQFLIKI